MILRSLDASINKTSWLKSLIRCSPFHLVFFYELPFRNTSSPVFYRNTSSPVFYRNTSSPVFYRVVVPKDSTKVIGKLFWYNFFSIKLLLQHNSERTLSKAFSYKIFEIFQKSIFPVQQASLFKTFLRYSLCTQKQLHFFDYSWWVALLQPYQNNNYLAH